MVEIFLLITEINFSFEVFPRFILRRFLGVLRMRKLFLKSLSLEITDSNLFDYSHFAILIEM